MLVIRFPLLRMAMLFAVVCSPVVSQMTGSQYGSPPGVIPALGDAQFRAIYAGQFTSVLHSDAVFLDDDELVLLMEPEVFRTRVNGGYSASVNDMAVLPGALADGRDGLVVVGSAGLELLGWNSAGESWNISSTDVGPWLGARKVRVGELNGVDGHDIVALGSGASSTEILVALSDGLGGFASTLVLQTNSGLPAREVHLLDWDSMAATPDAQSEIVVVSDYGIEVFDSDGTFLTSLMWMAWPMIATPVTGISGIERLCLVTSMDGGLTESIFLADETGLAAPINIGSLGVVNLTTWDQDGDGDTDVVLSIQSAPELVSLRYISPSEGGFTSTFVLPAGREDIAFGKQPRNAAVNQTSVAVADFDHDGDDDLLAPAQGTYAGGQLVNQRLSEVIFVRGDEQFDHEQEQFDAGGGTMGPHIELGGYWLWVDLEPAAQPLVPAVGFSTKAMVSVWKADSLGSTTGAEPLHLSGPFVFSGNPYPFSLDQTSESFDDIYTVVVRQVIVDGSGLVVRKGPSLVGLFGSQDTYDDFQQLPGIESLSLTYGTGPDENEPEGFLGTGPTPPDAEEEAAVRGNT